jgi:hypothetical protein
MLYIYVCCAQVNQVTLMTNMSYYGVLVPIGHTDLEVIYLQQYIYQYTAVLRLSRLLELGNKLF